MKNFRIKETEFWRLHPALLKGITFLIGTSSFLFWPFSLGSLWLILWATYLLLINKKFDLLLLSLGVIYSFLLYGNQPTPKTQGYFSITSLHPYHSPFHKGVAYKGSLYVDHGRVPCTVHYLKSNPPPANCDYVIKGTAKKLNSSEYLFKVKEWLPVKNTYSSANLRYELKEKFRTYLKSKLHFPRVADFFSALTTGDVEDRLLRYEFGKVGLQHLLAISGFHFALLIFFCSYFLGLFLKYRTKLWVLLLLILLYFLFVGNLPAVQRSTLMASLYLIAKLLVRNTTGLNLLGVALFVEMLIDPLEAGSLSFQLSFLSCFGILLFQPFFKYLFFHKIPKYDVETLSPLALHARLLSLHFQSGLIVTCAVNLVLLPLLLYHFQEFPLLGLLYNLFFPPLVSFALFLLLASLMFSQLFTPLGELLFRLTDFFTEELLNLTAYPPVALDYSITCSKLAAWLIPPYLFALFFLSRRTLPSHA